MKNKAIILFGLALFALWVMILSSFDWCFTSNDACVQKKIDIRRDLKVQLQANIDRLNQEINDLKKGFSAEYIINEAKQGRKQNVPPDLLTSAFHLIPTTHAATRPETELRKYDQVWDSQVSLSEAYPYELDQRLASYLSKYKSPITLPFLTLAKAQGLTNEQAILLLAIMGHESKFGTSYARLERGKGIRYVSPEVGEAYFNYAGIKWLPGCLNQRLPDENGFYLTKCPDQLTFLRAYFQQMKKAYFDKNCQTAMCMRQWYVGGNATSKVRWASQVNTFVREINNALL